MSKKDYITKALDIEDGIIEEMQEESNKLKLTMRLERHSCHACGAWTERVQDSRVRRLRDLKIAEKNSDSVVCQNCGKNSLNGAHSQDGISAAHTA